MKIPTLFLPAISLLGVVGCTSMGQTSLAPVATSTLMDGQNKQVGSVRLMSQAGGLMLMVSVEALAPGVHGIHLHTTGKCDAPGFTSANGHLNPMMHQHGSMNPAGPHLGDLPNLTVLANGSGRVNVLIPGKVADLESQLFDVDGTAIVIHAGPDDYKTDPSGNSGSRIACGVLSRP